MNYWGAADVVNAILFLRFHWWRKKLLFVIGMYALAPILSSLCVHSMEGDSSRTQISLWGNGKMAEMHAGATPFSRCHWKRKHWHSWHGMCDIFCTVILLFLQIDALSEIDRRRRNDCVSVTQRCTTGIFWDLSSGVLWLVCFLKHRRAAVYVIQIYRELEKMCIHLLWLNSRKKRLLYVLFWWAELHWKVLFSRHSLNFHYIELKRLKGFPVSSVFTLSSFPSSESFVLYVKAFTDRRPCYCMCAIQTDSWEVEGVLSWQSRDQLSFIAPPPATARQIWGPHDYNGTFLFFVWHSCISSIKWHRSKSFTKTQMSSVIILMAHECVMFLLSHS